MLKLVSMYCYSARMFLFLAFLFRFRLVAKNFEDKKSKEEKKNGKIFKSHAFFFFLCFHYNCVNFQKFLLCSLKLLSQIIIVFGE